MIRAEIPRSLYETFQEAIKDTVISDMGDVLLVSLDDSLIEIKGYISSVISNTTFYYGEVKLCEIFDLNEVHDSINQGLYKFNDYKESVKYCLFSISKFVKERSIEVTSNRFLYVRSEIFSVVNKIIEENYPVLGRNKIEDQVQYLIKSNDKTVILSVVVSLMESKKIYAFANVEDDSDAEQVAILFYDRIYYIDKLKFDTVDNIETGINKIVDYIINYDESRMEGADDYYLLLTINSVGTLMERFTIIRNIIDSINDMVSDINLRINFGYFNGDFDLKLIKGEDIVSIGKLR
ncbi:Conserved hypothetical protein [Saccharolobus solfataricus P2]|uniref:Uncharacterized protein n=1 Tax=Saccharolobus solfataricus (strain ATCC 35092 / DSM 1617 / JCM 11322 / P2) TaxID=273057 RepID=Q97U57_SACS2|nr:hypothetical protein [Saccharolobus solfataricus]AAK43265.1 Conserved hypothetical protein [Saccharolobus solfataricus P2]